MMRKVLSVSQVSSSDTGSAQRQIFRAQHHAAQSQKADHRQNNQGQQLCANRQIFHGCVSSCCACAVPMRPGRACFISNKQKFNSIRRCLTDREQKSCDIPLPAKGVFPAWASTGWQETSPYAEKPKGRSKHDN